MSNLISVRDILKNIRGDFTVERRPIFTLDEFENYKEVPFYSAVVRTDTNFPLSIVSSRYGIVQFKDGLDFLNKLIEEKQVSIRTAVVTRGGAKIFVICQTPDFVTLPGGDKVTCEVMVSTTHDGTGTLNIACTPFHAATSTILTPLDRGFFKPIKHSLRVNERIEKALRTVEKVREFWTVYSEDFQRFANIRLPDEDAKSYFKLLLNNETTQAINLRDKLYDIFKVHSPVRNFASCNGTLFGALVATMYYADTQKKAKKSHKRNDNDAAIESILTGDGARLKAKAYWVCLKLAKR